MSEKYKLSIIVPVYNVEKYLDKCVQSLISQTLKEIEIILVDDGSPDRCPQMCDDYAEKDSRIKVIHKINEGVSIARNAGLKIVSGEYYMFVDSDDWLDLDACKVAYSFATLYQTDCLMFSYTKEFGHHNKSNSIFDKGFVVWEGDEVRKNFYRRLFGPIQGELIRPQDLDILVSPCMQLFRSDKLKQIQFIDIREVGTFEDGLYQMEIYSNCQRFVYIDKSFYHYRKTNENSIVTAYKKDLYKKWECLYNQIEQRINKEGLGAIFQEALHNRIACGVLSLGLNEVSSNETFTEQAKRLDEILALPRNQKAIQNLKIRSMGIPWKVFFLLCKYKKTKLMVIMLRVINFIRRH